MIYNTLRFVDIRCRMPSLQMSEEPEKALGDKLFAPASFPYRGKGRHIGERKTLPQPEMDEMMKDYHSRCSTIVFFHYLWHNNFECSFSNSCHVYLMNYKLTAFWLIVFGTLFAFLQIGFQYHFYFIEQSQLFLFSSAYIEEKLFLPGGFSLLAAEFLVQFFALPYLGAAITAALLTAVGICTTGIVRQMSPDSKLFILYLLPPLALLFMHFDMNYRIQGTVSYLLMEVLLYGYLRIQKERWRMVAGWILTPLLFGLAGSIAVLFAVLICLLELLRKTPRSYLAFLCIAEVLLLGTGAIYFSLIGEYRWAFTPDMYYHSRLSPKEIIYLSWATLPFVVAVAFFLRNRKIASPKSKVFVGIGCIAQLAIAAAILWWGTPKYGDTKSLKLKKLDYYARTEQWDKTIEECQGKLNNYLYMCHLNMALANKGMLTDYMFRFDQRNLQGLMVQQNKQENISCLLSDIYFTMGATALSQEKAFEGYISSVDGGNTRMLKRLVQTNLIYGEYPVAEKYISLLEHTFAYRDWAKSQRKYLYNDEAIENDPVLGLCRRILPAQSTLAGLDGPLEDLEKFIEKGPTNSAALQYLGAIYLLSKDLHGLKNLLDKYYGTAVMPTLPIHFQEAVLILSEEEKDYWKRFNLSDKTMTRFAEYKRQALAQKDKKRLGGLLYRSHRDTYWFYFMFK